MTNYKQQVIKEQIKGNYDIALALLQTSHPLFLPITIDYNKNMMTILSHAEKTQSFESMTHLFLEDKLRYL